MHKKDLFIILYKYTYSLFIELIIYINIIYMIITCILIKLHALPIRKERKTDFFPGMWFYKLYKSFY